MAKGKDPAFLFYPGDWQGGTTTMSRHMKGCYIDLLVAQFNSGPLSLEEIKIVLGTDFAVWGSLSKKFKQTGNGLFFNERLEAEKTKRAEYSLKQKERVNKRWNKPGTHFGNTTVLPSENEDENEDEIYFKKESKKDSRETIDEKIKTALDELYIDQQRMKWSHIDFDLELFGFVEKVRGSPEHYANHNTAGIRLAFQAQLRSAKRKPNGKSYNKNDRTEFNQNELAIIAAHASGGGGTEKP